MLDWELLDAKSRIFFEFKKFDLPEFRAKLSLSSPIIRFA